MNQNADTTARPRHLLMRALFMLLMILAYQLSVTLLIFLTVIQFVFLLVHDAPNERLAAFGRSLGIYFKQIVHFLTFVTEEVPFPFSDWPSEN